MVLWESVNPHPCQKVQVLSQFSTHRERYTLLIPLWEEDAALVPMTLTPVPLVIVGRSSERTLALIRSGTGIG